MSGFSWLKNYPTTVSVAPTHSHPRLKTPPTWHGAFPVTAKTFLRLRKAVNQWR